VFLICKLLNYSTLKKRKVELVEPDVHLGYLWQPCNRTYNYLSSITIKTLVLNGEHYRCMNLEKSYFPQAHLKSDSKIISFASKGTKVTI
jgi:hypothetical protein